VCVINKFLVDKSHLAKGKEREIITLQYIESCVEEDSECAFGTSEMPWVQNKLGRE
jgi:hypothetical protein